MIFSFQMRQSGQSVIQVIVASGIMAVLMVSFASFMAMQNRETTAIQQRLAATDLENLLRSVLANGSVCKYILNNPTELTFDSTQALPQTLSPVPQFKIYSNIDPGPPETPGPTVAEIGKSASAMTNSLVISSIQFQIVKGLGSTYIGNWLVSFDPSKVIRAIKPVSISTMVTVDRSVPTATKFVGCSGNSGGAWNSVGTVVFNSAIPGDTWRTLDLSGYVGSRRALVILKMTGAYNNLRVRAFGDPTTPGIAWNQATSNGGGTTICQSNLVNPSCSVIVETDASGRIEILVAVADTPAITLVGFM